MIEIIQTNGATVIREAPITFEEIGQLIGGCVECATIQENGQMTQCLMHEDGRRMGQPYNQVATRRFAGKINNREGAVGVWVILSGKDLLK